MPSFKVITWNIENLFLPSEANRTEDEAVMLRHYAIQETRGFRADERVSSCVCEER